MNTCVGITLCLLALLPSLSLAQPKTAPDPQFAGLVTELFAAPDAAARTRLLAAHTDQANPQLVAALSETAGQVFDTRNYPKALGMYETVCAVARELNDTAGEARCMDNLGLTQSRLQRSDAALESLNRSVALFETLEHKGELVAPLNEICIQYKNRGEFRRALPVCERALAEANQSRNDTSIARTHTNLSNVYNGLGNFRAATQSLRIALEITRKLGLEREQGLVLNNLGSTYFEAHDDAMALSYVEQSLAIKEKRNDPQLATSVMNLGVIYESMGDSVKAGLAYDRALKLCTRPEQMDTRVRITYNYGNMEYHHHQLDAASHHLEEAIQLAESIGDNTDANAARLVLGEIAEETGDHDTAVQYSRMAIEFARQAGDSAMLMTALDLSGVALHSQEKHAEAEKAFLEGIQLTEQLREQLPGDRMGSVHFMNAQTSVFHHMILLQLDLKHTDAALAYAERHKARSLLDVLANGGSGITKAMDAQDQDRESALKQVLTRLNDQILGESHRPSPDRKRIADLTALLEKARTEYRAFESQLYAAHPQLKVQRVAFEPVRPADLIASLPDRKAALLEYVIAEGQIYLFVLTRGAGASPDLRVYHLATPLPALLRDARSFRRKVAERDLGYSQLALSLYRHLLAPAAAQLRGKTTLVLSPDEALWQLPFQALQSEPDHYLLQDFALTYTPSLSVLHEMQKLHPERRAANSRVLAMQAAQLPSARREIEGVREVYGPAHTQVYSPAQADEVHMRRNTGSFQVLHIAAHGFFEDSNPMNSYLLLAKDGKPEAGMLETRGLMDLNLRANLVVLSGCETGRGSAGSAEGMIGMSWALFIAGSPSLVASQWKVESSATTQLMLGFHGNLKTTGKAVALQQAALAVMKNPIYRHPFYWSGFVLMGLGF